MDFLEPLSDIVDIGVITAVHRRGVRRGEIDEVVQLHTRLHHAAPSAVMVKAIKNGAWPGVKVNPSVIEQVYLHQDCLACLMGKTNRLSRRFGSGIHPVAVGHTIAMDFKPVNPVGIGGWIGFYMCVETTKGYKWASLVKEHTSGSLLAAVVSIRAFLKGYGHEVRVLRLDAGIVEKAETLRLNLNELGIVVEPAAPEAQFQDPAERSMQTVEKGVAAVLVHQFHLGNKMWPTALLAFLMASNCCPNKLSGEYSPYYWVTGKHPDIMRWFKFYWGQPVVSVVLRQQQSKFTFAPHAEYGFAVGSTCCANGATLVYIPARGSRKFYVRRDVRAVKLGLEDRVRSMKEIQEMNHTVSEDGTINFPSIKAASQDYVDLCAAPWHPSHEMLEDDAILAKDIDSMEAICSEKVSGVQEGVQERTDRHDQEGVEERLGWSSTAGDNVLLDYDGVLAKKPAEQPSTCVSPKLCTGKEVYRKRGRPRKDAEHVVLHDSNLDELCVERDSLFSDIHR